jgi:hypothetical protein
VRRVEVDQRAEAEEAAEVTQAVDGEATQEECIGRRLRCRCAAARAALMTCWAGERAGCKFEKTTSATNIGMSTRKLALSRLVPVPPLSREPIPLLVAKAPRSLLTPAAPIPSSPVLRCYQASVELLTSCGVVATDRELNGRMRRRVRTTWRRTEASREANRTSGEGGC